MVDPDGIKENVRNVNQWIRGLFMLLFVLLLGVAKIVTGAVVVFQFVYTLVTGESNPRLRELGVSLAAYINQVILFMTFNTEEKPFPFDEWPQVTAAATTTVKKKASRKKAGARKKTDETKSEPAASAESATRPSEPPDAGKE